MQKDFDSKLGEISEQMDRQKKADRHVQGKVEEELRAAISKLEGQQRKSQSLHDQIVETRTQVTSQSSVRIEIQQLRAEMDEMRRQLTDNEKRIEVNEQQNEKDGESITAFMEDMVKHRQDIDTELEESRTAISELTQELVEV